MTPMWQPRERDDPFYDVFCAQAHQHQEAKRSSDRLVGSEFRRHPTSTRNHIKYGNDKFIAHGRVWHTLFSFNIVELNVHVHGGMYGLE